MWDTEFEARGHVRAGATSLRYRYRSLGCHKVHLAHLPFKQGGQEGGLVVWVWWAGSDVGHGI